MNKIRHYFISFVFIILVQVFFACTQKVETGPVEVRWDRVICERCKMAVSDHYYSAQVRGSPAEKRTKVYFFDDLGCAVIWMEKQEWKTNSRTEIWVNDYETGNWLDAKNASYIKGKITPMDFGLGATIEESLLTINYDQAVEFIYQVRDRKMKQMKHKHPSM